MRKSWRSAMDLLTGMWYSDVAMQGMLGRIMDGCTHVNDSPMQILLQERDYVIGIQS